MSILLIPISTTQYTVCPTTPTHLYYSLFIQIFVYGMVQDWRRFWVSHLKKIISNFYFVKVGCISLSITLNFLLLWQKYKNKGCFSSSWGEGKQLDYLYYIFTYLFCFASKAPQTYWASNQSNFSLYLFVNSWKGKASLSRAPCSSAQAS